MKGSTFSHYARRFNHSHTLFLKICLLISPLVAIILWMDTRVMLHSAINPFGFNKDIPLYTMPPRECDFEDIASDLADPHIWNRQWEWYYVHIPETTRGTIFEQLPDDYQSKFRYDRDAVSITEYEDKHGVQLRYSSKRGNNPNIHHPAHLPLDIALEMGLLRCSDIDRMNVISIVREPMERLLCQCNVLALDHSVKSMSDMIRILRRGRPPQASYLEFEYDWNVIVFSMENMDQITKWFAQYGLQVLFDEDDSKIHEAAGIANVCRVEDLDEDDRLFLKKWLAKDQQLYDAVRKNGGAMRIQHHTYFDEST